MVVHQAEVELGCIPSGLHHGRFQNVVTSSHPNATAHMPDLNDTMDPLHRFHHSDTAAAVVAAAAAATGSAVGACVSRFLVLPDPATPCTGRLCTAGVESMRVYRLSLTFSFSYVLLLRHACVLKRLLNSSTGQTRAGRTNFLLNVVKRRQVLDHVYIHFVILVAS